MSEKDNKNNKETIEKKEKIEDKKAENTIKFDELKKEKENIKSESTIIEVGEKEATTLREKTKIFFDDLKIRFKNLFSPEKDIKYLPEYYNLPYRYNKDTVKILAQTPKKLFVYWDFDDSIKNEITEKFGEYFWDKTYPVLIVKNITKNYSFEIQIDDFANSWYIDIPDDTSTYTVEIGRKLKEDFEYNPKIDFEIRKNKYIEKNLKLDKENLTRELLEQKFIDQNKDFNFDGPNVYFSKDEFINFGSSNEIITPSGRVMFDSLSSNLKFRNIITGDEHEVELRKKSLLHELYGIYDDELYKEGESRSSWLTSSGLAFERKN